MFLHKLEPILKEHPEWEDPLRNIEEALSHIRSGQVVDPVIVATETSLKLGEVIALLQVLTENDIGRFQISVSDDNGLQVKSFSKYSEIPDIIQDSFDREIHVGPQNIDLLFMLA